MGIFVIFGAQVTNSSGSVTVSDSILITDCNTPVSSFPYVINYDQQDVMLRACWQLFFRGNSNGFLFQSDNYFSIYISQEVDNWYVSPLFDLSSNQNIWLELNHLTPGNCLVTVELSQGGLDSDDFTTIYTLPAVDDEDPVTTQPINLSEYNQGNPVRLAIRMRHQEGPGDGRFELHGIRLWDDNVSINAAESTTMALSPNPARQAINVTLPDPEGTLTLFDATGRQLMQRHTAATHTTVNVSTLTQGVYLLQFTSPRGTTTTRFLVQ